MSRMVIIVMVWAAAVLVPRPAGADEPASEYSAAFEARLEADLASRDPAAVQGFEDGNAAREQERWPEAVAAYERAVEADGDFVHAHRRLCTALARIEQYERAREHCRIAQDLEDAPENDVALMVALASDPELGPTYREELASLVGRVVSGPAASDPESLMAACQSAAVAERMDLLERCVSKLRPLQPGAPETHMFAWMLAMADGDFDAADAAIDAAEAAGLDPVSATEMREITEEARPLWLRLVTWLGIAVGVWFGTFFVLVVVGMALSRATLRSAASLPTSRTGQASGGAALLRRSYALVLALTCGFYYLSLPLVVVLVVTLAGGIIFGMLAIGHISLKLTAILAVGTLAIVGALLKSLFVRVDDSDPGERLDLTQAPQLRAVLDEVAAKIGTRPVDNVYLVPGADIAVLERGSVLEKFRGTSERCFILGVAVLDGMSARELKAILAHEYGHFSNRDTAGGGLALAVRRSILLFAEGLAREGMATNVNPSWLFVTSFHKLFLRISQGASRLQEVLADRWAVYAYGADAFEGGLRHAIERELRFDLDTDAYLEAIIESKQPLRNLYEESLGHVSDDPEQGIDGRVQAILEAEPSPFDSHPRPVDRFRWARALEQSTPPEPDADEGDAWSVVGSREVLQLQMTEFVRTNVAHAFNVNIPAEGSGA